MKKTKLGLWTVIAAGAMFSLTACKIDSSRNVSNNGGGTLAETPAVTVAQTEPTVPIELTASAELTEAETTAKEAENDLQKLLWWEDELGEGAKILYPGFELDCEVRDDEYYRVFRSAEKGVELWERVSGMEDGFPESRGEILLRNSESEKEYSVGWPIGNLNNSNTFTTDTKKLFFCDLTDDGQEELIVSLPVADRQMGLNSVHIFDARTLEPIGLPEGLREKVEGEIAGVTIKEVDDGIATVDVAIGGRTYEAQTSRMNPDWALEDLIYEISIAHGGYYVGEAGVYYRTEIIIYHRDYLFSPQTGRLPIDIPMEYDGGSNAFAAVEGEYLFGG